MDGLTNMSSVYIDHAVYRQAEEYAQRHNLSLKEIVEAGIHSLIGAKMKVGKLKSEEELAPEVRSLIGVASGSDTQDYNGHQAREEYLMDKHDEDFH